MLFCGREKKMIVSLPSLNKDIVAEWLRRWIANPLFIERVSSNLTDVGTLLVCWFGRLAHGYIHHHVFQRHGRQNRIVSPLSRSSVRPSHGLGTVQLVRTFLYEKKKSAHQHSLGC